MSAPPVFGYVRAATAHRRRVERWRTRIASYCGHEGMALELVFADVDVASTQLVRPAWTALLDVLALREFHMVIVPSGDHLSCDPLLQADLRAQLAAAGAVVVAMPRAAVQP